MDSKHLIISKKNVVIKKHLVLILSNLSISVGRFVIRVQPDNRNVCFAAKIAHQYAYSVFKQVLFLQGLYLFKQYYLLFIKKVIYNPPTKGITDLIRHDGLGLSALPGASASSVFFQLIQIAILLYKTFFRKNDEWTVPYYMHSANFSCPKMSCEIRYGIKKRLIVTKENVI